MFRRALEIICNFVYYCAFCTPNMSGDWRRVCSHTWRKAWGWVCLSLFYLCVCACRPTVVFQLLGLRVYEDGFGDENSEEFSRSCECKYFTLTHGYFNSHPHTNWKVWHTHSHTPTEIHVTKSVSHVTKNIACPRTEWDFDPEETPASFASIWQKTRDDQCLAKPQVSRQVTAAYCPVSASEAHDCQDVNNIQTAFYAMHVKVSLHSWHWCSVVWF